jgi:hypothetical protein
VNPPAPSKSPANSTELVLDTSVCTTTLLFSVMLPVNFSALIEVPLELIVPPLTMIRSPSV